MNLQAAASLLGQTEGICDKKQVENVMKTSYCECYLPIPKTSGLYDIAREIFQVILCMRDHTPPVVGVKGHGASRCIMGFVFKQ